MHARTHARTHVCVHGAAVALSNLLRFISASKLMAEAHPAIPSKAHPLFSVFNPTTCAGTYRHVVPPMAGDFLICVLTTTRSIVCVVCVCFPVLPFSLSLSLSLSVSGVKMNSRGGCKASVNVLRLWGRL